MNEEWRKLSVTVCVYRSCFYYDRKLYSEWFAILGPVKMFLGENHLSLAKRASNFQTKNSSFVICWGCGGEEEEKWGKAEESDQKKSSSRCCRPECWGQRAESHLPKSNLVHYINIWGKVSRKTTHGKERRFYEWVRVSSPNPDKIKTRLES